jgi:hypothetical protein
MHRVLAILAKAETFPEIEVFSCRSRLTSRVLGITDLSRRNEDIGRNCRN